MDAVVMTMAYNAITELMWQSAKQRGALIKGQELLLEQNRIIQERLWEIKQQNGGHREPTQ